MIPWLYQQTSAEQLPFLQETALSRSLSSASKVETCGHGEKLFIDYYPQSLQGERKTSQAMSLVKLP